MKISDIGEFGLIELLKKELPENLPAVVKGIGDDTAVLKINNDQLQLMTTDMLVEGVHFSFDYAKPWQVGAKALNVNISDIVAMGGTPTFATIAIGIPKETDTELVRGLYKGIGDMACRYNVSVVGGDTVSAPVSVINITLMGVAEVSKVIYRSGAKPGDAIFVTGSLGGSSAGLYHLQNPGYLSHDDIVQEITELHLVPLPRVIESKLLSEIGTVTSMNDISDGLASELYEIGQASGVGCQVYSEKIPINQGAQTLAGNVGKDALDWAFYGGEDFQLVFTVNKDKVDQTVQYMKSRGKPLFYIGEITEKSMVIIDSKGNKQPFHPKGYDHFSQG